MSAAQPVPVDMLALRPACETILDSPAYWYRLAEEDQRNNPGLVAEYLRMAALMERYLQLRMGGAA